MGNAVAQRRQLTAQLRLRSNARIQLLKLRGQPVDCGEALLDVVEPVEALVHLIESAYLLLELVDLAESLLNRGELMEGVGIEAGAHRR